MFKLYHRVKLNFNKIIIRQFNSKIDPEVFKFNAPTEFNDLEEIKKCNAICIDHIVFPYNNIQQIQLYGDHYQLLLDERFWNDNNWVYLLLKTSEAYSPTDAKYALKYNISKINTTLNNLTTLEGNIEPKRYKIKKFNTKTKKKTFDITTKDLVVPDPIKLIEKDKYVFALYHIALELGQQLVAKVDGEGKAYQVVSLPREPYALAYHLLNYLHIYFSEPMRYYLLIDTDLEFIYANLVEVLYPLCKQMQFDISAVIRFNLLEEFEVDFPMQRLQSLETLNIYLEDLADCKCGEESDEKVKDTAKTQELRKGKEINKKVKRRKRKKKDDNILASELGALRLGLLRDESSKRCNITMFDIKPKSLCVEATPEFIQYARSVGYEGSVVMQPNMRYCVPPSLWQSAIKKKVITYVDLDATHLKALEEVKIKQLEKYKL